MEAKVSVPKIAFMRGLINAGASMSGASVYILGGCDECVCVKSNEPFGDDSPAGVQ